MTEKDYQLYGTKILNLKTQEIGLLICIWKNTFADGEVDYATCVDKQGIVNAINYKYIIKNTYIRNGHIKQRFLNNVQKMLNYCLKYLAYTKESLIIF